MTKSFEISCPLPLGSTDRVLMAHGGGGRRSQELVRDFFMHAFADPVLSKLDDAAVVEGAGTIAMTTDSYVVRPLEFRGGDIGTLAVYGTVNDLAMVGAVPLYLTVGFILEEGLLLEQLWRIVTSMRAAASRSNVRIVAGDTKVVERGRADGLYINTTGVGRLAPYPPTGPASIEPGAVALLSGDIGRHGIAVMAARADLGFATDIESDCAPLHEVAMALCNEDIRVYCMRDLTRGGLASALVELAQASDVEIEIDEAEIEVVDGVHGACELLGLDPMYVANEGRFVVFVASEHADRALALMREHEVSARARRIGTAHEGRARVVARTALGSRRLVEMFSGEQLPRIC